MLSKAESAAKKVGGDSGNQKLLGEIEAISKGLYLDKIPSKSSIPAHNNVPSKSSGRTRIPETKTRSNNHHGSETPPQKEKKSIWNWPLRALSHVRNRRFNCCFSLHVHSIDGLPMSFNDLFLKIHWKRRDAELTARPIKVYNGSAEFEETLTYTCSVYGSRSGPHHSAKYEAKHFLVFASLVGTPVDDLGKHRIDLTRLLPLTLEELQNEKSSAKWSTTFQLTGRAKGATLSVSFGYTVLGDSHNHAPSGITQNARGAPNPRLNNNNLGMMRTYSSKSGPGIPARTVRRTESLPSVDIQQSSDLSHLAEEIKDLHEVLPTSQSDLASSLHILHQKFEEDSMNTSEELKCVDNEVTKHLAQVEPVSSPVLDSVVKSNGHESENTEVSFIGHKLEESLEKLVKSEAVNEQGVVSLEAGSVEVDSCVQLHSEEGTSCFPQDEESDVAKHDCGVQDQIVVGDKKDTNELLMKDLESALKDVENLETAALDISEDQETNTEVETTQEPASPNLDGASNSVASEFLSMLGIEHSPFGPSSESEPESPRERLLREFQMETLATGSSLFDFGIDDSVYQEDYNHPPPEEYEEDIDLASIIHDVEQEFHMETEAASNRSKAKVLEDLETEALMREWGLNERTFQTSPSHNRSTTFSPADIPPEEPLQLPPLGEGLGPFLQTQNGGFLRSMNSSLFKDSKIGGSLVMQVSSPVVVPAEMGSGIIEILQQISSVGIEKLSMQANKLMPLDDITGKTLQQVAWEASPALEAPDMECLLQHGSDVNPDISGGQERVKGRASSGARHNKLSPTSGNADIGSDFVSLEDLAPLAMDKMEALSLEGLKIQSGLSGEDAPSNITAESIGQISALQGKSGSFGLEGAAGLQLLDIKDNGDEIDGLLGLSLTLDEWMKLDSGDIGDENDISEHTSKILAAHHANSLESIRGGARGEKRKGKGGRRCGLLGNNFTVALMVQLRDPLRNYEPVGAPMLSLIQVERVFVPPKPKIYSTVSELRRNSEDENDESDVPLVKDDKKEEIVLEEQKSPLYKITDVHVAGLKSEPGKKKLWGNSSQQQAGSRWLLANGMGKGNKHPLMKAKSVAGKSSAASSSTKVQPGETLWSISARVHGTGSKWKELAALNPHIRNPNIIMPNETIRLR